MERIIAYCGLLCNDCEAYQATQVKDSHALEQVAAKWRVEYQTSRITADNIVCNGCLASDGVQSFHCGECATRACGVAKGVANCGECPEYESCERIQSFFKFVPSAKIVLDEVHQARMKQAGIF